MINTHKISKSLTILLLCTISACDTGRDTIKNPDCPGFENIPILPYSSPIWHPSGKIIGFNHTPIKEIKYLYGEDCPWQATYIYQLDSTGFWLINSDGTSQRRILPFELLTPAWSNNGKWIAFSKGGQIFKMPFTGEGFDTAAITQLTFEGRNFSPGWSSDDEWIAFDSSKDSPTGLKFIWKMRKDGSSKKRIAYTPDKGETRAPSWSNNFNITYQAYIGVGSPEIFAMDSSGNNRLRITDNTNFDDFPRYSPDGQKIAFISQYKTGEGIHLCISKNDGSDFYKLTSKGKGALEFSWSPDNRLVYVSYDNSNITDSLGNLWIMEEDGSNQKQLTHNNFVKTK